MILNDHDKYAERKWNEFDDHTRNSNLIKNICMYTSI